MKFVETQTDMFPSYQKIYDAIVTKTWANKESIFGAAENGYGIQNWFSLSKEERITSIESTINKFVQSREYSILLTCNWRLDLPCGSDVLSLIL
jgi:hypothetical protein